MYVLGIRLCERSGFMAVFVRHTTIGPEIDLWYRKTKIDRQRYTNEWKDISINTMIMKWLCMYVSLCYHLWRKIYICHTIEYLFIVYLYFYLIHLCNMVFLSIQYVFMKRDMSLYCISLLLTNTSQYMYLYGDSYTYIHITL